MDVTISQTSLSDVIQRVTKIVARQTQLPVLKCVLVIAEGSGIKFRATNLDIGVEIEVPARIQKPGVAAIPGDLFGSLVGQLPSGDKVRLHEDGKALTLEVGRVVNHIHTLPYEDFPILPSVAPDERLELKAADLVTGLKAVWYGAPSSSMKPELSSVLVSLEERGLVCAATDSFRLAEKVIPVKTHESFSKLLVPVKNVPDIIRNLETVSGTISLAASDTQLALIVPGMYLTSRVIDGVFPDYRQIMPKSFETNCTLLKQDLIQALKIANVFANTFNQITLTIDPKHKNCTITTKNPNTGESTVTLDAAITGSAMAISFNHRYITDCFQTIGTDSMTLSLNGQGKPMVVTGVGDKSFTYLVMPMNR